MNSVLQISTLNLINYRSTLHSTESSKLSGTYRSCNILVQKVAPYID